MPSAATHPPPCVLLAGMDAGPSQAPSAMGEAMVTSPRGDTVRVPFFRSPQQGDTFWVVPLLVFYQAVVQQPTMPQHTWTVEATLYISRRATAWELSQLHQQHFLATSTTSQMMIPLDQLIDCLEEMSLTYTTLDATLQSLMAIQAHSTPEHLSHSSVAGGFAQIPSCTLTRAQLSSSYSLKATFPEYFESGTVYMQQGQAAFTFYCGPNGPPIGSGHKQRVRGKTFDMWMNSFQEFMGYCKNFEGLEPNFMHLRNLQLVANFVSFRLAKGNGWNTVCIELENLQRLLAFAFFPSGAPHLPVVPQSAWAQAQAWFSDILAKGKVEAAKPENKKRKITTAHLAKVWDDLETKWATFKTEFLVGLGVGSSRRATGQGKALVPHN